MTEDADMKKFFIALLVIVVLLGAGAYAASRMVSVDKIKVMAQKAVHDKTGRDLAIGDAHLMLWPSIGVRLTDVSLSNPSWAKEKKMAQLAELDVNLALRPLLRKKIEVKNFEIKKPVINLEVAADGRKSWAFTPAAPAGKPAAGQQGQTAESGGDTAGGLPEGVTLTMGKFLIQGGQFSYDDAQSKKHYTAKNLSLAITWPDMQSRFQMDGAMDYNGKRVNLVVSLDKPMDLINGKTSPGEVNFDTDQFKAAMKGTLAGSGTMLDGTVDAKIDSLDDLLAWAGQPAAQALPIAKLAFSSKTQITKDMLKLTDAHLTLDDIKADGNVQVKYGSAVPAIIARLSVNKLNLDRFTGGAVKPGEAPAKTGATATGQTAWDDTPIDFGGLKAVNADLVLKTDGFSLKGADVGPCTLTVNLQDGVLDFNSTQASLFGGTFSSNLGINAARPAAPSMSFVFKMAGVQAQPVLATFANFKKLSGAADANVSVTSSGTSQKAIIGNLAGTGDVVFRNGALEGIDLVNIAQLVQKRLDSMGVGAGKTNFVDMGGTFVIANGVAVNNDFKMKGPLVQATGAGNVDLPQKQVTYRVLPVLTASSAVEGASGITIPVDIYGPFNKIKIKPDYKSVIKNALSNPDEIKATAKTLGAEGKQILKDIKQDPHQAIQNLLGGGLFGKKAPADNSGATAP
jgi:AsmA protein